MPSCLHCALLKCFANRSNACGPVHLLGERCDPKACLEASGDASLRVCVFRCCLGALRPATLSVCFADSSPKGGAEGLCASSEKCSKIPGKTPARIDFLRESCYNKLSQLSGGSPEPLEARYATAGCPVCRPRPDGQPGRTPIAAPAAAANAAIID